MDDQAQQEMYRLTKENNRMLHAMRRNAFWGGILKFIFWTAILIAPIWFYMAYLNDAVQRMMQTYQQMAGTGAKAQAQLGDFSKMFQDFESKFGGGSSSTKQ